MTYQEAIVAGEKILNMAEIVDAKSDAWLLLEMACKIDRNFYYMHMRDEMPEDQVRSYQYVLTKRAEHVPLQYITGEQEFMGLTFRVNSGVLIPRQDTESLVEEALKRVEPGMKVLDMCSGSGCIIISMAKKAKIEGFGADISRQAINVAKENAKLNEVAVEFVSSDLFEHVTGEYDMIVSNPPYIPTEVINTLMPEVKNFEPIQALDGMEDGLYFYRRIVVESRDHLKEGGYLLFEIGHDQGESVPALMREAGFEEVTLVKDLALNDRVVIGKRV